MGLPPESIELGKCYLTNTGRVWRIINLLPDGRILYEHRPGHVPHMKRWQAGIIEGHLAAEILIEREVACDWKPEREG